MFTHSIDKHFAVRAESKTACVTGIIFQDPESLFTFQIEQSDVRFARVEIVGPQKQGFAIWRKIEKPRILYENMQGLRCASVNGQSHDTTVVGAVEINPFSIGRTGLTHIKSPFCKLN